MSNVTYIHPVDIPCKIQLIPYYGGIPDGGKHLTYFRTDPMKNDGWIGCDPLGTKFSMEEKIHIKNTLTKQGKYINLLLDDEGDIVYEVIVTVCPKDEWYKEEI